MKEILSLFLSMIMICSCLTVSGLCAADQSAENFGNYFTYSVSNGNASITGIQSGIVVAFIPSVIDNYPVTTIAGQAFKNNQSLRYLYIPGSVRLIDYEAFCGCPCLEQVILSEGLELDEILCINENCDIIKT